MPEIRWATRFRRDVKLCKRRGKDMRKFAAINERLSLGHALPVNNRDHLLTGNWRGHRECHIEPDWLLIYRLIPQEDAIEYVRTGTHADLFE